MALKKIVQKYYLHYDKKTGSILSVSNEKTEDNKYSFEVPFSEYKLFLEGYKNTHDHIITYAKGISGKTELSVVKVTDSLYEFKNKSFEWINKLPKKNTELIVEWDKNSNQWIFTLSEDAKERLKTDLINPHTIFFIMLKNDFDFLIRSIVFKIGDLIIKPNICVPFTSEIENHINKISISTKLFFHSYGLKIND
jgi:hypothetical protein